MPRWIFFELRTDRCEQPFCIFSDTPLSIQTETISTPEFFLQISSLLVFFNRFQKCWDKVTRRAVNKQWRASRKYNRGNVSGSIISRINVSRVFIEFHEKYYCAFRDVPSDKQSNRATEASALISVYANPASGVRQGPTYSIPWKRKQTPLLRKLYRDGRVRIDVEYRLKNCARY